MSDTFTPRQWVQALREVLQKDIELKEIDRETFLSLKNKQDARSYEYWAK